MAIRRDRLARAPIVEALIDIRIAPLPGATPETFASARASLAAAYPVQTPMQSIRATFSIDAEQNRQTQSEVGLLFRSADGNNVAQFRVDGFTFNRLNEYTDWPTVFGEALRLWRMYSGLLVGAVAQRLAVRYLNRFTVRSGSDLADYLTVPPELPADVPQLLREYLARYVVEDSERHLSAVLLQALEPGAEQGTGSILLDIDAFRDLGVPLAPTSPAIEAIFLELRDLKNQIFYACITEQAVEQFS